MGARKQSFPGTCERCGKEREILRGMCQRCRYSVKEGRVARGTPEYAEQRKQIALVQRGNANAGWKGGRFTDRNGYIRVKVQTDDSIGEAMMTTGRWVMEHRLVVAHALGRPLARSETVHHVNGVRDDNRIENLQLRSSHHGAGIALRCLSCGSHDIESVPIA